MLESFLAVLTRIAVALETIAATSSQTISATLTSTPASKGKSKKAEAAGTKLEPATDEEIDEKVEELKQETKETKKALAKSDDIKFDDVKKAFYGVLGKIKEKNDGDLTEAKKVSAALSAKFVKGGGQPTENNTDSALYGAFLEAINQAAEDNGV